MRINSLLGELLVERNMITRHQLDRALAVQKTLKEPVGQILVSLGILTAANLRLVLSEQLGVSFLSSDQLRPSRGQDLFRYIPADFARANQILPLLCEQRTFTVVVSRTPDAALMENLRKMTKREVITVLATDAELRGAIEDYCGEAEARERTSMSGFVEAIRNCLKVKEPKRPGFGAGTLEEKFIEQALQKALEDRATEVHLEPVQDRMQVRYRLDGTLYELPALSGKPAEAVTACVKFLAGLNTGLTNVPQDGAFSFFYNDRPNAIRVSTVPSVLGEKIILKVLNKRADLLDLGSLGLEPQDYACFEKMLTRSYGMIFAAGPAESGKSTTLYATLTRLFASGANLLTIENPVEFKIPGIHQVQVDPEIGLTFASGLRAFLRQDPDVILVGETFDFETAELSVRAALTGHLVLSSLHARDSVEAIRQLVEMGVAPYLLAGSMTLVVAQRLVRILCPHCKETYKPDRKTVADLDIRTDVLFKPKGCPQCRGIGYWGRTGVFELFPVDGDLRRLIVKGAEVEKLRDLQKQKNYGTLLRQGISKAERGITSLEELRDMVPAVTGADI